MAYVKPYKRKTKSGKIVRVRGYTKVVTPQQFRNKKNSITKRIYSEIHKQSIPLEQMGVSPRQVSFLKTLLDKNRPFLAVTGLKNGKILIYDDLDVGIKSSLIMSGAAPYELPGIKLNPKKDIGKQLLGYVENRINKPHPVITNENLLKLYLQWKTHKSPKNIIKYIDKKWNELK